MAFKGGDSAAGHNFGLQIDGVTVEYLQEVSSLTYEMDVIESKENTPQGKSITRKMPGTMKPGECTVTRGATESTAFTKWIKDSMDGNMDQSRKNATIIIMDYQNKSVKRFNLRNAWAHKVEMSASKAGDAAVRTEQVTITFEELVIE